MTLEEALALTTATQSGALGKKQSGQLVQAADWNTVVQILTLYGQTLQQLGADVGTLKSDVGTLKSDLATVKTDLGAVKTDLGTLKTDVADLKTKTAPLLQNYLVAISADEGNYVVGEAAEISVSVLALDGQKLSGARPWVDLFATWGRLSPAPGFVARENAEQNAISVQVNADGIAKVRLRSHYTKGIAESDEAQISSMMEAKVGTTGKSAKQIVKEAPSPSDGTVKQVYKMMSDTYTANASQKRYVDGYVNNYAGGKYWGGGFQTGTWQDYRATVIAFAKPDADPLSPDPARGVATIQIDFREWVPNWATDFDDDIAVIEGAFDDYFKANLDKGDLLVDAINHLDQVTKDAGLLEKARNTKAMKKSVGKINPGSDPDVRQTKELLDGAMQMQLAAGIAAAGATDVAMSYVTQAKVSQQAGRQAQAAQADTAAMKNVKVAVDVLEGKMQASEATAREIKDGLARIGDGVNKINVVEVADLGTRLQKISTDLSSINLKLPT